MTDGFNTDWKNIYGSNLNALKQRYPDLYEKLLTVNKEDLVKTITLDPANGVPDIVFEDRHRNVLCYGSDDPVGYCRQYLASLDLHYAPVIVFLGFGLGYQVTSVINDFAKDLDIQHIIIIEKDIEIFRAALTTLDYSDIINHPMVEFIVGAEPDDVFKSLMQYYKRRSEIYSFFKSLKTVIMPSVCQVYSEYYQKVFETLKRSVMFILQQLGSDPYDSILGITYTIHNVKPIIEDPWIIAFKDVFKGYPAILVGAGPSLNKDIGLLKEASQKALIVCVDAALKPLLDKGIKPHIVTNIERLKGQSGFFTGLKGLENTYFVYCSVVYPDTYASYHGPKIITHRYDEMIEWLGFHTGVLSEGPLVGNLAFNIIDYFGCDPIIMVGQDLSIPQTGPTHVEGMVFGTLESYRSNMLEVEGNSGQALMTTRSFEESRRRLQEQIEKFGGLCINTALEGARINGTVLMDMKNAVDKYCNNFHDFTSRIESIWEKEKANKPGKSGEIKRTRSVLDQSILELRAALNDCKKGMRLIKDFETKFDFLIDRKPNPQIIEDVKQQHRKICKIRENIVFRPALKFLLTAFGGYYTNFNMRRNYMFDQFHDRRFAVLKAFLMEKEAFKIIGQLLLSTIYSIEDSMADLSKELI